MHSNAQKSPAKVASEAKKSDALQSNKWKAVATAKTPVVPLKEIQQEQQKIPVQVPAPNMRHPGNSMPSNLNNNLIT